MRGSIGTATGIYHRRLQTDGNLKRMFSSVLLRMRKRGSDGLITT